MSLKALFLLSLSLVLFTASHADSKEQSRDLANNANQASLPGVVHNKNKCLAIAKKKRKSFSDKLYQKLRCKGIKLPKPKLPSKPKMPKMPKLKLPKLPKIHPRLVPKAPVITFTKARKKPSPSPRPKRKRSKKSRKKSTKRSKPTRRSKKRSRPKKPKTVKKPSPTPSRTPSPRPRPRPRLRTPSPSPSIQKLKDSLESSKKRLLSNIQKHEKKASKPKVCKNEKYTCGKKCSGRAGPRFFCNYPNQVPKFCERKTAKMGFCPGDSGKQCYKSVMEPDICTRNVTVTEYCPGAEEGCKLNDVPFGRCLPDECDRIRKKKCDYNKRTVVRACEKPSSSCQDCKSRFLIKKCPRIVKERVTVPCPGKKSLPSFDEELVGDGIESIYVRDILCFDSFFDESICKDSPRVCRLFDEMFDRHLCAGVICQQCAELMSMHVSRGVKDVCRGLLEGSCTAAGEFLDSKETKDDAEVCYGSKTVEKMVPCYESLPKGKVCSEGCVVKSCTKTIHEAKGYCEKNLPARCVKSDAMGCRRETRRVRDCSGERICEYVVKKPYLCFREKRVEVPCEGGCEVLQEERYVCGSEEKEVDAVCREQFDHSCRDLVCSRQVCR